MALPTEITQSNGQVAEVRMICDECGETIGTLLMRKAQAEAQRNTQVICQHCREEKKRPR